MSTAEEGKKARRKDSRGCDDLNVKVVKKARKSSGGSDFGSSPGFSGWVYSIPSVAFLSLKSDIQS